MQAIVEEWMGSIGAVKVKTPGAEIRLGEPQKTVRFNVYTYYLWHTKNHTIRFDSYHKIMLIDDQIYVLKPVKSIKGHPRYTTHSITLYDMEYIGRIKDFKVTSVFRRDFRLGDLYTVAPIIELKDGRVIEGFHGDSGHKYILVFETVNEDILGNHALTHVSL